MNIYSIRTTVQHENAIVDFQGDTDAISDLLIYGRGDLHRMTVPLRATAQAGYTAGNIASTDYIAASIRVPVFSTRFQELLGESLSDEIEFIPCLVECDGQTFRFFAGKIEKTLPVVDTERSMYRKLASGTSMLLRAVYRTSFESRFLICRDASSRGRFVVSSDFKRLCDQNGMNIEFGVPV
ncbi:hypothetical protein DIE11_12445 [Burkholderia sp. Bp9012]|uniref:hypothetical protein n=1 Tax=Burkholderia sp. Bp9012 TaxID=2184562 RepID=UPI000F5935B6|nr:hypothetical protein [Burkholderia sp. Bp9012]RQR81941.1 hypothetical protein DIE11_12445 [Burkholderia sp. Bp9012]